MFTLKMTIYKITKDIFETWMFIISHGGEGMRISDSTVNMTSQTITNEKFTKEEKLRVWVGNNPSSESVNGPVNGLEQEIIEISKEALAKQEMEFNSLGRIHKEDKFIFEISDKDKQKLLSIQKMIEALTGKKLKFYVIDEIRLKGNVEAPIVATNNNNNNNQQQQAGWGLEYDYHESFYEKQVMNFNSEGIVRTSDGREINFSVSLNMSHEFASSQDISIRAGDAAIIDPLVINFEGQAPQLTAEKYSFDIDCDGALDQISFITQASGFLALDKNGDGVINDGNELFGPQTNDGFMELSQYDTDEKFQKQFFLWFPY